MNTIIGLIVGMVAIWVTCSLLWLIAVDGYKYFTCGRHGHKNGDLTKIGEHATMFKCHCGKHVRINTDASGLSGAAWIAAMSEIKK